MNDDEREQADDIIESSVEKNREQVVAVLKALERGAREFGDQDLVMELAHALERVEKL